MSGGPSEDDLLKAVTECLDEDGKLDQFRAELRASLSTILDEREDGRRELAPETKLINDLIREYLIWNGYVYADQVFSVESGSAQNSEKPNREYLAAKLGVEDVESTTKIPLLYYIVYAFLRGQDTE